MKSIDRQITQSPQLNVIRTGTSVGFSTVFLFIVPMIYLKWRKMLPILW